MYKSSMSQRQLQNNHNKPSYHLSPDFPGGASGNAGAQETGVPSLGQEDPLEEGMATHSSILAWKEEPGGLQSMGSQSQRIEETWRAHNTHHKVRVSASYSVVSDSLRPCGL